MGQNNAGARYRELGAQLRERRRAAGLSQRELGQSTGWSATTISRIETGQARIDPVDAVHYLGACGIWRAQALDVLKLCRDAESGLGYWLSPHGEWLEDSLAALIYHESTAATSTIYEPLLVHGLLQTADYARAQIAAERWRTPDNVEECVRIRMGRQQILDMPHSARFNFFLHEQALRLVVGDPAIMHDQLLKIALLGAVDNITIRVVPGSAGERSGLGGSFALFEYAQFAPLVYLDNSTTGLFLEDDEFVDSFRGLVPTIAEVALDEGQSRKLIVTLASECDQRSVRDVGNRLEEEQL